MHTGIAYQTLWLWMAALPAQTGLWKLGDPALRPPANGARFASKTLGKFAGHSILRAHREGDGSAEIHKGDTDVFVVESGTARLVVGGSIVRGRVTAPGEIRGASILNGEVKALGPGDIVHIAAGTPHQLLDARRFTYLAIKVAALK